MTKVSFFHDGFCFLFMIDFVNTVCAMFLYRQFVSETEDKIRQKTLFIIACSEI